MVFKLEALSLIFYKHLIKFGKKILYLVSETCILGQWKVQFG